MLQECRQQAYSHLGGWCPHHAPSPGTVRAKVDGEYRWSSEEGLGSELEGARTKFRGGR